MRIAVQFYVIISAATLITGCATTSSDKDYASFSGETYKSVAPNGNFLVQAHQEKGYYKFEVELIELPSSSPVLSFDPKARFIGAAWSSDSKLVAIEQNKSTHDSMVSVFSIDRKAAKRLSLPKECDTESSAVFEPTTRKHAKKADSLKFHFTSEGLQVVKWLSPDELVLSASGMGWWGGVPAEEKDARFLAEYEVTIHFATDGRSSLRTIVLTAYKEII
jgi:hypothetical protein